LNFKLLGRKGVENLFLGSFEGTTLGFLEVSHA
jgi:hypothetical protein